LNWALVRIVLPEPTLIGVMMTGPFWPAGHWWICAAVA
jgi:hypothetical protein